MSTKVIRECAASHVFWTERNKETPSALIRWTIPSLCDRVDELEAEVARLRSALERTEANFRLAVAGKPVRDMAENLAENRAAMGGDDR